MIPRIRRSSTKRILTPAGDFEALEHEAHTLIGAAGNIGAKALSTLAALKAKCEARA